MSVSMLIEGKLGYDWESDTLSGGLGVGLKYSTKLAGVDADVGVGTMLTFTVDGKTGTVSEIDWKANADASLKLGGVSAGGSYEASVMHGNKFTPEVSGAYQDINMDFL